MAHGHEPLVVHRGATEPDGLPDVPHLHAERRELPGAPEELHGFGPEAAIDCYAMSGLDAEAAIAALPHGIRLVVLSSVDVYRAFGSLQAGCQTDALPVDEESPLREERYLYRGQRPDDIDFDVDTYEKLDVEEAYRGYGATVCRLPFVYGEHDHRRREEFVLRRVRAGRARIPVGAGTFLGSRCYVRDVAGGIRLALEADVEGEVLNLAERRTWPVRVWAERILAAAGSDAELVRVPEEALPSDLEWTGGSWQHLLVDASKARALLGWEETDPDEAVCRSVAWHLAHPPLDADPGFSADDAALRAVVRAVPR